MNKEVNVELSSYCKLPMRWVGPLRIGGDKGEGDLQYNGLVPLATYEAPIWNTVDRGARISQYAPIETYVVNECMTRSVLLKTKSLRSSIELSRYAEASGQDFSMWTRETSAFCEFQQVRGEIFGDRLWLRFSFTVGNASGHNMATKAATHLTKRFLAKNEEEGRGTAWVLSDSGNLCCDKKVSSVNALLGRGVHVQAQMLLSKRLCQRFLRADPEKIAEIALEKNWIGSCLAGSLHSANAHFANMLLAFYLATGQDGANVVEGSQAQSFAELQGQDLLFTCRFPHIIVGTVGAGKNQCQETLHRLGCCEEGNTRNRLAQIIAAATLCGELSLLGALANPGELISSHQRIERGQ